MEKLTLEEASKEIEEKAHNILSKNMLEKNGSQTLSIDNAITSMIEIYNLALSEKEEESKQNIQLFEIDFGGNVLAEVKVEGSEIEVLRAINGHADKIFDYKIIVKKTTYPTK